MSHHNRHAYALGSAAAAAALLILPGCSSAKTDAVPLPPKAPSAAPVVNTPAPTPTASTTAPVTPEAQAVAQAEDGVRRYYEVTGQVLSNPSADLARFRDVAMSGALVDSFNLANSYRRQNQRLIGTVKIASMSSRLVTLTFKPTQQPPVVPTVKTDVCYDVSGTTVVDATGKSVVSSDRRPRGLEHVTMNNYSWPAPGGWKVATSVIKDEPCTSHE